MFLTVHATAGVIIGQQTGNIWLGFLAGFVSHIALDIIPHGDQNLIKDRYNILPTEIKLLRRLGILDGIVMLATLAAIYSAGLITKPMPVLLAVAGAIVPDYINAIYIFFKVKWLKWYFGIHYQLHYIWNGFTINFRQGLVVQLFFLIGFLTLLINQAA